MRQKCAEMLLMQRLAAPPVAASVPLRNAAFVAILLPLLLVSPSELCYRLLMLQNASYSVLFLHEVYKETLIK